MADIRTTGGKILQTSGGIVSAGYGCCCDSPCTNCVDDLMPNQVQVDLSGITTTGNCSLFARPCESGNATYILSRTSDCIWQLDIDDFCCQSAVRATDIIQARAFLLGSDYILEVSFITDPVGGTMRWRKNYGTSKPDCRIWASESVSVDSNACNECDITASTCLVTSL